MGFYIAEIDKNRGRRAREERIPFAGLRLASASYRQACQSSAPQALVKVVSHTRNSSVRRTMEYIARDGEQALETESGESLKGKDQIKERFNEWLQDFERAKPGTKRPPRHATHMILSAKCENTAQNARRLESAARQFLHDRFAAQGYEYVWTVHRDTQNPHVHVVLKNHNRELNRKIRIDKPDLAAMREEFANHLTSRGIEQVATRRMDRVQVVERVATGVERAKKDMTWYRATLTRIENEHATKGVHAPNWLTRQVRQADYLRKILERDVSSFNPQRAGLLKQIKSTKKEVMALASQRPGAAARATVKRIGEDLKEFGKALAAHERSGDNERESPASSGHRARLEARRKREGALSKWWEKQKNDIASAQDFIKSSIGDAGMRREALKELAQYQKSIERTVGRSLGHGLGR